jgi:uroporphyrin-III C-methyltransferase
MRWVAQISEYWPLERLATLNMQEAEEMLSGPAHPVNIDSTSTSDTQQTSQSEPSTSSPAPPSVSKSQHNLTIVPSYPKGRIYLLGSGPGHPGLLTVAAHEILTRKATLVLSDKLVPAEVLALIPDTIKVKIAKKFPGNADGAQNELMLEAVEAASKGEIVVRVSDFLNNHYYIAWNS